MVNPYALLLIFRWAWKGLYMVLEFFNVNQQDVAVLPHQAFLQLMGYIAICIRNDLLCLAIGNFKFCLLAQLTRP